MGKDRLRDNIADRVLRTLLELLLTEPQGNLDGTPFAKVSTDATGRRFIIKGWIDTKQGPAVRFSAPWGDLGNGQVMYQANPQEAWEDTEEQGIELEPSLGGIELSFSFTRLPDGAVQNVSFRTATPLPTVAG